MQHNCQFRSESFHSADDVKELQGSASFLESVGGLFLTASCCLAIILRQRARRRFNVPPACDARGTPDGCLAATEDVCLLCVPCCSACAIAQVLPAASASFRLIVSGRHASLHTRHPPPNHSTTLHPSTRTAQPGPVRACSRPLVRVLVQVARHTDAVGSGCDPCSDPGPLPPPSAPRRLPPPPSPRSSPRRRCVAGPAAAGCGGCVPRAGGVSARRRCRTAAARHGEPHAAVRAHGVRGSATDGRGPARVRRGGRRVCAAGVWRAAVGPRSPGRRRVGARSYGPSCGPAESALRDG